MLADSEPTGLARGLRLVRIPASPVPENEGALLYRRFAVLHPAKAAVVMGTTAVRRWWIC